MEMFDFGRDAATSIKGSIAAGATQVKFGNSVWGHVGVARFVWGSNTRRHRHDELVHNARQARCV